MSVYKDAYNEFWGRYSRVERDRIRRELKRKGIKPLTPIELGHLKSLLREHGIDDWVSEVDPYISYEENVEQIEERFGSLPSEEEFSLRSFARSVGEGFCDYVHELVEELMREEPDALKYIAELGYKDVDSFLKDVVKEGILPEYEINEIKEAYGKKKEAEKTIVEGFTVANFPSRDEVVRSASFISHIPERYYEAELHDYEAFIKEIIDTLKGLPKEKVHEFLNWASKGYIDKYEEMLHFRGRVASPLVVGPSKFPSQEKKLESLRKRENELKNFKEKVLKRAKKLAESRGLSELEATKIELDELKHTLEVMKEANKIVRSKKLSKEEKEKKLREIGAFEIEGYSFYWPEPDFMGRIGFPSFELESVRRAINTREERLKRLEKKEEHKGEVNVIEETKDYKIVEDYTKDRVLIYFTTIPPNEVREALKSKGWRWSPHWKAWSRKLTKVAIEDAKEILAKFYKEGEKKLEEEKGAEYIKVPAEKYGKAEKEREKKEPWEMTREEFKKQSYSEIFNIYERINPFRPNDILRRYVDELNKYLKRDFKEKLPQSWMQLHTLLERVYSDIEAKQPNKIPYDLKKEVANSYGFRVEPGHRLIGFDLVILPDIHRQIVEEALKEGKPVPDEVLKDYPGLAEKYGRAGKERERPVKDEKKIKIGAGWETIVGYNVDFIKSLFPDWKWDKKKGTLTAPNEKIVIHALFSEIAPELEPHKTEILRIFHNLRSIFEKLGYELVVERPEEGKRVFFERARKDLKRLYDILGLEEVPGEEEPMKENKEFIKEKLRAVFTSYLKGAGVSEKTIEEELKEKVEEDIESLAEAVASGRQPQSYAIELITDLARHTEMLLEEEEEVEEEEEEEEEEERLPVVRPAPFMPERKPVERKKKRIRKVEEVTPEIAEPSAIAEKILREYPDELLTFGVRWVCENRRRELGFVDGANLGQVAWWLTKELRKKGDKIMARAKRGVVYAAGMLLANQPDIIVTETVRRAMNREWDKIRTFVSVNYPDVLVKLGGRDLQLIILGYVYKLLGAPYAGMPEDIRKALRTFEQVYGD